MFFWGGLDEEVDNYRGQILRLAKIDCFISKKVILEQYVVMNGKPFCSLTVYDFFV